MKPLLFGALCALSAVPCFLLVRLNRIEGAGSSPPRRDHWWAGWFTQGTRIRWAGRFVPVLAGAFILLQQERFAGVAFEAPALLGFSLAQALFWALILIFSPALREDQTELSQRASARARRRRSKPSGWLALGLCLTILGSLLLFPGGVSSDWSGRIGAVLLAPAHLILGFLCISSMFRVALDGAGRWGFVALFFAPPLIALVVA